MFQLVAVLKGTFLGTELRYQQQWWVKARVTVACFRNYFHCLVPVSSMPFHYRCDYLVTTTSVVVLIISNFPTTKIKSIDLFILSKSL